MASPSSPSAPAPRTGPSTGPRHTPPPHCVLLLLPPPPPPRAPLCPPPIPTCTPILTRKVADGVEAPQSGASLAASQLGPCLGIEGQGAEGEQAMGGERGPVGHSGDHGMAQWDLCPPLPVYSRAPTAAPACPPPLARESTCTPYPAGCSGRVRRGSAYPWHGQRLHHRGPGEEPASVGPPIPTAL